MSSPPPLESQSSGSDAGNITGNNNNDNNTVTTRPSVTTTTSRPTSTTATTPTSTPQHFAAAAPPPDDRTHNDWTEHFSTQFEDRIGKPSRVAIHSFFYPPRRQTHCYTSATEEPQESRATATPSATTRIPATTTTTTSPTTTQQQGRNSHNNYNSNTSNNNNTNDNDDDDDDRRLVHHFWTTYDDILILSLFTQLGIVFRLASAAWFARFDQVFNNQDSPLFTNLPLNCLSCFFMGILCSGDRLMEIIATRFSPPTLQQDIVQQQPYKKVPSGRQSSSSLQRSSSAEEADEGDGLYHQDANSNRRRSTPRSRSGRSSTSSLDHNDDDDDDNNNYNHGNFWSSSMNLDDSFGDFIQMPQEEQEPGGGFLRRRRRRGQRQRQRRRLNHAKNTSRFHSWQPPVHLYDDLRDVQLLALERRIRASKCLILFPVRKQDIDVMEHYFQQGYQKTSHHHYSTTTKQAHNDDNDDDDSYGWHDDYPFEAVDYGGSGKELVYDLELNEHVVHDDNDDDDDVATDDPLANNNNVTARTLGQTTGDDDEEEKNSQDTMMQEIVLDESCNTTSHPNAKATRMNGNHSSSPNSNGPNHADSSFLSNDGDNHVSSSSQHVSPQHIQQQQQQGVDQMLTDVTTNVTQNITRFRRANIADGWDAGTTPEAMSDDLMLGLRDGFCGALSSFSSWVSTMVNLLEKGKIEQAFVGLLLGLQLPILAYRFGQHVAVYVFVWRARFESQRDARRGYGIRVAMMDEQSEREQQESEAQQQQQQEQELQQQQQHDGERGKDHNEIPSVRAVITALFIMALVTQCTSLSFYADPEHQQVALSLLFSPLGVLARWRLSKYNTWRPTFPLGTFTANLLACALSGSLGSLLAGNPGPRESIVLQSIVAGFGGTMSSLATFVVEILAGIDPILFRFDGMIYAVLSIGWAMVICFLLSAAGDWADTIGNGSD